jgi:hypothetical protein
MVKCPKCRQEVDEGPFCGNCGAPLAPRGAAALPARTPPPPPQASAPARAAGAPQVNAVEGVVGKLETMVFFRVARGYAWLIAFLAFVGLAVAVATTAPLMVAAVAPADGVSAADVRSALENRKKGGLFGGDEDAEEKIDPKALAKLDQAVYEVIQALPPDFQGERKIEQVRDQIRSWVSFEKDAGDRIALLKSGKAVIEKFDQGQRWEAMQKYLQLLQRQRQQTEERKALAVAGLLRNVAIVLGTIITITLASMVLVLLAVERNTRRT